LPRPVAHTGDGTTSCARSISVRRTRRRKTDVTLPATLHKAATSSTMRSKNGRLNHALSPPYDERRGSPRYGPDQRYMRGLGHAQSNDIRPLTM
jgi:hypothetical protein